MNHIKQTFNTTNKMKEIIKKIVYPLIIFVVAASCSAPRYASAQDDGYYDNNNNYSNNDNSYNNNNSNNQYNNNDDADNYYDEPSSVNINIFNDALTPYGTWVVSPSYGRSWVPAGYTNFIPYSTGGHWVYSSYGWTWASDYSWGWAPFHYGRWAFDPIYGWMWVPGYQWGPAWVAWRSGGGYYGWTPLGPGMSIGINMGFNVPYNQWVFAPSRYMGYPTITHYYARPSYNTTIIHNTTIINTTVVHNNTTFVAGPNRVEVERFTGRPVNQVRVVNASAPGRTVINNNNTMQIYRPGVVQRRTVNVQGISQDNVDRNNQVNQQNQVNRGNDVQDNRSIQQMNTPQRNLPSPDVRDGMNNSRRQYLADIQQRNAGDQQQSQVQRNPQQDQSNNAPQRNQQNMPSQDQQDRMRNLQQHQMDNRSNNDQQRKECSK